jgi:glycine C-acetyltransferase
VSLCVFHCFIQKELQTIEDVIFESATPQGAEITISTGETVLNFVPTIFRIITSEGRSSGKRYLRYPWIPIVCPFICGGTRYSQDSRKISSFCVLKILFYMQQLLMQTEVFFEPVFGEGMLSFQIDLNHASIIGVRFDGTLPLCKCDMKI